MKQLLPFTRGSGAETRVSAAALRPIEAGGQNTWTDAALLRSSSVALLLLHVLAQQRPHLLLVLKRTGTETGAQPGSVLGRQSKNQVSKPQVSVQHPSVSGGELHRSLHECVFLRRTCCCVSVSQMRGPIGEILLRNFLLSRDS